MPFNSSQGMRLDSDICISTLNRTNEIELMASADSLTTGCIAKGRNKSLTGVKVTEGLEKEDILI